MKFDFLAMVATPGTNKEAVAAFREGVMKARNAPRIKAKPEVVNHLKARFYSATKK